MRRRRIAWCCGIAALSAVAWLWFETTSPAGPRPKDTVPVAATAPSDAVAGPETATDLVRLIRPAPATRGEIGAVQLGRDAETYVDPDAPTAWSPGHPPVHVGDYVDPEGPELTPEEGRTVHVGEWLDPDGEPNDGP